MTKIAYDFQVNHSAPFIISSDFKMMPKQDYRIVSQRKREQRDSRIPAEWKINLPPKDQIDVRDIPEKCGLLTPREVEITGSSNDAVDLLTAIREKTYSAEEVTRAFCKRAAVAQQLVQLPSISIFNSTLTRGISDELPHRNLLRRSNRTSKRTRSRTSCQSRQAFETFPRITHKSQRLFQDSWV